MRTVDCVDPSSRQQTADQIAEANSLQQAQMADDETQEMNEESKKDREDAEQAKALNAVTDNVSSSSGRLYAAVSFCGQSALLLGA